jgi:hypothetical protein
MDDKMMGDAKAKGTMSVYGLKLFGMFFDLATFTAADGALTQLHLATAEAGDLVNGGNYHPIGRLTAPGHAQAKNETLQKMVWAETERLIEELRGGATGAEEEEEPEPEEDDEEPEEEETYEEPEEEEEEDNYEEPEESDEAAEEEEVEYVGE